MRPNLFIVGFQKCGSSTLFDILANHPNIIGTKPKETFFLVDKKNSHYNSLKNISNPNSSWNIFYPSNATDYRYRIEGSVLNFYQNTALEYVKNHLDSKVIFIIRDPVERFISNYKYYFGKKISFDTKFEDYINKVKSGFYEIEEQKYAIEHGKYVKYIKIWTEALGKERIHIVSFKKLIKETKPEINHLFKFLDEKEIDLDIVPHKNISRSHIFPSFQRIVAGKFKGEFIEKYIRPVYKAIFMRENTFVPPDDIKAALRKEYEEEYLEYSNYF